MKIVVSIIFLLCMGTPAGYAQAMLDSGAESKIIALERAKLHSSEAKDLGTLDTLLDNAFVYVDAEGKLLNKPQVMAYFLTVSMLQFATETMAVRLHGDTAIVTGQYRMKGVERGKPFVQRNRFVDTWLHKDGQWVAIASLSTPVAD